MKARILVGLVAVALGGLTSCSNILEENGVINNVAKGDTGELRISLNTDPSVSVVTKAISAADGNYIIKLTNDKDNQIITKKYSEIQPSLKLANGTYTIEAYNKEAGAVEDFGWNAPYYKTDGTDQVTIAGDTKDKELICVRANSTLVVDTTKFGAASDSKKILYVKSLTAKNGETSSLNLLDPNYSWTEDSVCVKAGIPATIELVAVRLDNSTEITIKSPLKKTEESDEPVGIDSKTRYNVVYLINDKNGELTLTVKVNDKVTSVDVPVDVDPYKK